MMRFGREQFKSQIGRQPLAGETALPAIDVAAVHQVMIPPAVIASGPARLERAAEFRS
jgi:hypothetical protein